MVDPATKDKGRHHNLGVGNAEFAQPIDFTVTSKSGTNSKYWPLSRFSGWYDFVITRDTHRSVSYELAGHVETGDDSISDPMLGGLNSCHGAGDDE